MANSVPMNVIGRATAGIAPHEFVQQLTKLARARRAQEAAAYFEHHSADVLDRLSQSQRFHVDELMEYVDTVVDLQRATQSQRQQDAGDASTPRKSPPAGNPATPRAGGRIAAKTP